MSQESDYDRSEVARRGSELYQRVVKSQLRPEDMGLLVAIDVETGSFEVAQTMHAACRRLHERHPNAQIWGVRAGFVAVHSFGARPIPEQT